MNVDIILLNLLLEGLMPNSEGNYFTKLNSEALAVMYLESVNHVKILDGRFPETKFITFKIARDLLSGLE